MRVQATLLALALAAVDIAVAQAPAEDTLEPPVDRYQIEVLLFGYSQPELGGENFALSQLLESEPEEMTFEQDLEQGRNETVELAPEPPEPVPLIEFEPVPSTELTLTAEAERLSGISAYRVLAHGAWRQPGVEQLGAQPFPVGRLRVSGGISGSLTFHVRRFPHLALDLEMPSAENAGTRFRLQESRRMRRGELHYFDHPSFGALVQVTRLEEEETG